jgi:hypothetical protein
MKCGRHIDQNARMVWLALRSSKRAMTLTQIVTFWRPTFSALEIEDALTRLVACNHVEPIISGRWFTVSRECHPLPDIAEACLSDDPYRTYVETMQ